MIRALGKASLLLALLLLFVLYEPLMLPISFLVLLAVHAGRSSTRHNAALLFGLVVSFFFGKPTLILAALILGATLLLLLLLAGTGTTTTDAPRPRRECAETLDAFVHSREGGDARGPASSLPAVPAAAPVVTVPAAPSHRPTPAGRPFTPPLELVDRTDGGIRVLGVAGDLVPELHPLFRTRLERAADEVGDGTLVIDCEQLDGLDESAIQCLLHAYRTLARRGGRLILGGTAGHVDAKLRTMRLDLLFPLAGSLAEALALARGRGSQAAPFVPLPSFA